MAPSIVVTRLIRPHGGDELAGEHDPVSVDHLSGRPG
jgi:hypothetical protein